MFPLSNSPFSVAVWATEPVFLKTIVSPALAWMVGGLNVLSSCISIVTVAAWAGAAASPRQARLARPSRDTVSNLRSNPSSPDWQLLSLPGIVRAHSRLCVSGCEGGGDRARPPAPERPGGPEQVG